MVQCHLKKIKKGMLFMDNSFLNKIVVGNGFDLASGCKTSYKDFFASPFFPS